MLGKLKSLAALSHLLLVQFELDRKWSSADMAANNCNCKQLYLET